MPVICPAVLARNPHNFRQQMERIAPFAERVQIDLMDGVFTPHRSIELNQVWWPAGVQADLHLMYKTPLDYVDTVIALKPSLLIVHAEADGNFLALAERIKSEGIKVGLALLKPTTIAKIEPALTVVDHILIFSGDLGSFGGRADVNLLEKVEAIKVIDSNIEVGWDGGINDKNARELIEGGVDVLNVGDFIQRAEHPGAAYATLKEIALKANNGSETN